LGALPKQLYGANGKDSLDGGAGIDFLSGGNGDDTLTGGTDGSDLFYFENDGRSAGINTITDFQVGSDPLIWRLV
jgi:Ca2+-binding RTX toxin-like protein